MKSNAKKVVSVLLLAVLLMSLFCGCKKETAGGDVPTITWYLPCDSQKDLPDVLEKANEILVSKVGAKLDLKLVDSGSYAEKMNMVIASNQAYDICFTSNWLNNFATNVSKGAYMAIDKYLDEVPEFKNLIDKEIMKVGTINGKTYAVPVRQVFPLQRAAVIEKKYIEELNFDTSTVKRVEDLEPFFEKFHKAHPEMYTVRTYDVQENIFTLRDLEYVGTSTEVCIRKSDKDAKVYPVYETDEWKYAVKKLAEYYEKGYIRKDIDSVMDDTTDLKAGKYAVYFVQYKPGVESEMKNLYGRDVVAVPVEQPYMRYNAGITTMNAVSRNCKNPELAVKVMAEVATNKELYNLLVFGIQGVNYELKDGHVVKSKDNPYELQAWTLGDQFMAYPTEGQSEDVWTETEKYNASASKSLIMGFLWDPENVKTEIANISTARKKFSNFYLKATGSEFDKKYKEYCDAMATAGHKKIVEEAQKQVDAYLKE